MINFLAQKYDVFFAQVLVLWRILRKIISIEVLSNPCLHMVALIFTFSDLSANSQFIPNITCCLSILFTDVSFILNLSVKKVLVKVLSNFCRQLVALIVLFLAPVEAQCYFPVYPHFFLFFILFTGLTVSY